MKKISTKISSPVVMGTLTIDEETKTITELFNPETSIINSGIFLKNLSINNNITISSNGNTIQLIPNDEIFIETKSTNNISINTATGQTTLVSVLAN